MVLYVESKNPKTVMRLLQFLLVVSFIEKAMHSIPLAIRFPDTNFCSLLSLNLFILNANIDDRFSIGCFKYTNYIN